MFEAIKHSVKFYRDPISFLTGIQKAHGDYHLAKPGSKTVHFVFDPQLARSVLGDPLTFIKTRHVYNKIKPITGDTGLVQIEGEAGLSLRKAFNGFFTQAALDQYLESAEEIVSQSAPSFEGSHDVRGKATELVLQTALSMFAGVTSEAETQKLSHFFLRLNDLCAKEFKNMLPMMKRAWELWF